MSTRCYVGTADPTNPHLVHARFVLCDGYPAAVVPTLVGIWSGHAHRDTRALATAVLAHDWEYLDEAITAAATSPFAGQHPVPGVGMTLATTTPDGSVDPPEPISVFPLSQATHLEVVWIYLIDPVSATVTVHTDDGEPVARYQLHAAAGLGSLSTHAGDGNPDRPGAPYGLLLGPASATLP